MDKECAVHDGYYLYKISSNQKSTFLIDRGEGDSPQLQYVPLFRIVNGLPRSDKWNGDISGEPEGNDWQCLLKAIREAEEAYDLIPAEEKPKSERLTVVFHKDSDYYGICVTSGILIGLIDD